MNKDEAGGEVELMPCPFCGSGLIQRGKDNNGFDTAFCAECLAETALENWNRRTRTSQPAREPSERIANLRLGLEMIRDIKPGFSAKSIATSTLREDQRLITATQPTPTTEARARAVDDLLGFLQVTPLRLNSDDAITLSVLVDAVKKETNHATTNPSR